MSVEFSTSIGSMETPVSAGEAMAASAPLDSVHRSANAQVAWVALTPGSIPIR